MTKEELEKNEKIQFDNWLNDIYERYGDTVQNEVDGEKEELSWFEHNLEVWRQL